MDVVLRKLGTKGRVITGRLVRKPRCGAPVVVEFAEGTHEYITTPVTRILRLPGRGVFFIATQNSRYRLEVCGADADIATGAESPAAVGKS